MVNNSIFRCLYIKWEETGKYNTVSKLFFRSTDNIQNLRE